MRKVLTIAVAFAFAALLTGTIAAQDDSLAEHARQVRKDKAARPAAKKVYTDDDVPHIDKLSEIPSTPSDEARAENAQAGESGRPAKVEGTKPAGDSTKPAEKKEEPAPAKQKDWDSWKGKLQKQKEAIALAQRELDVLQRELRIRQATYYSDIGQRMQNSAAWDREDASYREQIDKKQKEVDSAKAKLEDLQEQARRAGVPASIRE
jgi:hypothetical protein